MFVSWSPFRAPLGAVLEPFWVIAGASCAVLGASWELKRPSQGGFGGILDGPPRCESRTVVYRSRLGGLLGPVCGLLEASGGPLGDSWGPVGG
eukprot:8705172-Pyramimonas_sp.AAC.1